MSNAYQEVQARLREQPRCWLVTGAAGFIGSNLVEQLLVLQQKVIGLDNFETGCQDNLDQALLDAKRRCEQAGQTFEAGNFHFIQGDILDLGTCQQACQTADIVLHQAALGSVPRSIKDPIHTNKANIDGFLNMLVAAKDAGVNRFVYAASSSTYGDHPGLPKVENRIGNPLSPYAVTKYVNELYAQVFADIYNIEVIGLRYFNVFGKRQSPDGPYAAVIPKWVGSLLQGETVTINGDGETSRDFCFVENTVQINLLAAMTENQDALNQVYNVALNEQTTLNELYELLKGRLLSLRGDLSPGEAEYRDFRAGDVRHSRADIGKAQRLLGYAPSHKIDQGLDETMAWYVKNLT